MRARIILTVLSVLVLFGNVYGIIINVPGDSLTIQSAINGASLGDTILVAEGQYYERLDFLGKDILLTSNYLYTADTLTIQNTIIDADTTVLGVSDTMSVIIFCNGETSDAVVQGFTIQNGAGFNYNGIDRWFGGGIYCDAASPTIKYNIIHQNSVAHGGGGLCGMNDANVTVIHNTFTENHAGKSGGGGIMIYNSFSIISYNDIIGNTTDTTSLDQYDLGMGGGIYSCNSQMDGSNTITHNNISENIACTGGGICCYVLSADIVSDNEISNNIATGENNNSTSIRRMRGGGISLYHTFHGIVANNVIADNYAGSCGGGIHVWLNHAVYDAHINNNIITGNISDEVGGGICTEDWLDNGFIIANLLVENVAINGAGISFLESNGNVMGNTIANNSASNDGGSLHGYSTTGQKLVEVTNTICWNNGTEIWNQSSTQFVVTYCDIAGSYTGTGNIDADPLFADPENCDFHLTWTNFPIPDDTKSPCIDAGDPASQLDPDGTIADIGAFYFDQENLIAGDYLNISNAVRLFPNYPNPFNPSTTISFALNAEDTENTELVIYNLKGQKVKTLINEKLEAGNHQVTWDGKDENSKPVSSGIYFYKMKCGDYTSVRKMILLK